MKLNVPHLSHHGPCPLILRKRGLTIKQLQGRLAKRKMRRNIFDGVNRYNLITVRKTLCSYLNWGWLPADQVMSILGTHPWKTLHVVVVKQVQAHLSMKWGMLGEISMVSFPVHLTVNNILQKKKRVGRGCWSQSWLKKEREQCSPFSRTQWTPNARNVEETRETEAPSRDDWTSKSLLLKSKLIAKGEGELQPSKPAARLQNVAFCVLRANLSQARMKIRNVERELKLWMERLSSE